MNSLSAFLLENKQAFLKDISSTQGDGWTIVMGNDAGDLDSCASSIAYSYLSSTLDNTRTIALIQTLRDDFDLRPENLLAFGLSHLDANQSDLLTIDDITSSIPLASLRSSYALVDHNSLSSKFAATDDRVTAIFDHHEDDKKHQGANPRIIQVPTGSCASLVTDYFHTRLSPLLSTPAMKEVASLLISAIVIDTDNLKPDGKAVPVDHKAVQFLYPISTFGTISATGEASTESKSLPDLAKNLDDAKRAILTLSGLELLRRDYKPVTYGSDTTGNFARVGFSTVPMSLDEWIKRDTPAKFWADQMEWIAKSDLTFSAVLTTFRTKDSNKHKRQMLVVFPSQEEVADAPEGLEKKVYDGIEENTELEAERRKLPGIEGLRARAWDQKNKHATRKTIIPAMKKIIEGN